MAELILPWEIHNDTPADGSKVEDNYTAIKNHVDSELIHRDGSVAMTGQLVLFADPTSTKQAATMGYVDGKVLAVDNNNVNKTGDTMTGVLAINTAASQTQLIIKGGQTNHVIAAQKADASPIGSLNWADAGTLRISTDPGPMYLRLDTTDIVSVETTGLRSHVAQGTNVADLTRKDYVDSTFLDATEANALYVNVAGDTVTGMLTIDTTSGSEQLRLRSATPYMALYNEAGTTRYGYLQGSTTAVTLESETGVIAFVTDSSGVAERARLAGTELMLGKTTTDTDDAGTLIAAGGSGVKGRIFSTTADTGGTNLDVKHMGSANLEGKVFVQFLRGATNSGCGAISQGDANNSVFNAGSGGSHVATSDYRVKDDLGPITDPVERLMQLAPKHLRWNALSGTSGEFDNFIAHEVAAVVPNAVVGEKDAVLPNGDIDAQGLDNSKLVPLLTAALQEALIQIGDLTDRIVAMEDA